MSLYQAWKQSRKNGFSIKDSILNVLEFWWVRDQLRQAERFFKAQDKKMAYDVTVFKKEEPHEAGPFLPPPYPEESGYQEDSREDDQIPEPAREDMTCFNCPDKDTCEWAWDDYNTGGDCLAGK